MIAVVIFEVHLVLGGSCFHMIVYLCNCVVS